MEPVLLLILLLCSGTFSGAETAFFSLGAAEVARLRAGGGAGSRVAAILDRGNELLSALLMGNLLVNTALSVVATGLCLQWFGPAGMAVAVPGTTLLLLLLGEITPKLLALNDRRRVALAAQRPLALWLFVATPALRAVGLIVEGVLRLVPLERTGSRPLTTAELQTACDLAVSEGSLSETEGRSLARLLQLSELEVKHIMTPRTSVVALHRGMTLRQVLGTARRAGFNRYPVADTEGGAPTALFHLKDLLGGGLPDDRPLGGEMRPLLFVPETKDVAAMLAEMRGGGAHLAAVIDEHGDFTGIVTMADGLEALLGPVGDAASVDADIIRLGEGRWLINGRTDLRELQEACGLVLPASRDYVTVAGYMMTALGSVLQPGDRVTLPQARLTVLEMSGHRIDRIQVTVPSERRAP